MRRTLRPAWIGLACFATLLVPAAGRGGEREIPPAFAPLEYLVGSWKGQGVAKADRVRGWTEVHAWAWTFIDGKPVGMTVAFEGAKQLKGGSLAYDEARKRYVLTVEPAEGSDGEAAESIVYEGTLDASRKLLTLDRQGVPAGKPAERLTLRANSNYLRYTLGFEHRSGRSGPFSRPVEVGLTKEGETFAAGGSTVERPKCVVTGGAAGETVSYEGKSLPLCCSGCRDEFLESPEKYIKKAAAEPAPSRDAEAKPAPERRPRGGDDF